MQPNYFYNDICNINCPQRVFELSDDDDDDDDDDDNDDDDDDDEILFLIDIKNQEYKAFLLPSGI